MASYHCSLYLRYRVGFTLDISSFRNITDLTWMFAELCHIHLGMWGVCVTVQPKAFVSTKCLAVLSREKEGDQEKWLNRAFFHSSETKLGLWTRTGTVGIVQYNASRDLHWTPRLLGPYADSSGGYYTSKWCHWTNNLLQKWPCIDATFLYLPLFKILK